MIKSIKIPLAVLCAAIILAGGYYYIGESQKAEAKLNDADADPQSISQLVEGNNKFSFDLYSELSEEEGNIFFSPWSIYTALAMTYEGARGNTATEMSGTLHLPENDLVRRPSFARIQNFLNENLANELETANALWSQENYPFLDKYLGAIENYYGGKITNLDFIEEPEKSRQVINDWVSDKTRGKIEELLKKGTINPMIRLILTNAIYFKGSWATEFDKEKTEVEDFWIGPQNTVDVEMMNLSGDNVRFNYAETESLKAMEMPYKGGDVSMIILLPKSKTGLEDLESQISYEMVENLMGRMKEEKLRRVKFPKFELKTEYNLKKTLKDMGMQNPFIGGKADFSGMTGSKDLYIDFVTHKAYVKVNEEGTEAAAATAVGMTETSIDPKEKTFEADHPFMFLIQEKSTNSILFLGSLENPA